MGTRYPVIQGGMAWVSDARLAAAVSNAGGLGVIAAGNAPAGWVQEQIALARTLTDQPLGLNVMLLSPYADEVARLAATLPVDVIITGAGNPGEYIGMWKEAGKKILPVVPSTGLAIRMERLGVDGLIAEGTEAGGHIGELTTMVLVPQVVDAVSIPVFAAGGIGDARGTLAAWMLGASGVQLGTRFLLARECGIHDNYKEKVLKAKDIDTVVTGRPTGHPVRVLKNQLTREFLRMEREGASVEELETLGSGCLQKAVCQGDTRGGSFMAGQIAGLLSREETCAEIIEDVFLKARELFLKKAEELNHG